MYDVHCSTASLFVSSGAPLHERRSCRTIIFVWKIKKGFDKIYVCAPRYYCTSHHIFIYFPRYYYYYYFEFFFSQTSFCIVRSHQSCYRAIDYYRRQIPYETIRIKSPVRRSRSNCAGIHCSSMFRRLCKRTARITNPRPHGVKHATII